MASWRSERARTPIAHLGSWIGKEFYTECGKKLPAQRMLQEDTIYVRCRQCQRGAIFEQESALFNQSEAR